MASRALDGATAVALCTSSSARSDRKVVRAPRLLDLVAQRLREPARLGFGAIGAAVIAVASVSALVVVAITVASAALPVRRERRTAAPQSWSPATAGGTTVGNARGRRACGALLTRASHRRPRLAPPPNDGRGYGVARSYEAHGDADAAAPRAPRRARAASAARRARRRVLSPPPPAARDRRRHRARCAAA